MAFAFKPIELVPHKTKIRFSAYFRVCISISVALAVGTVILLATSGLNFGIDFKGGTMIAVRSADGPVDMGKIRSDVEGLGLGDIQIQEYGRESDVLIRVALQPGGDEAQQAALSKVQNALGDGYVKLFEDVVGATVSGELIEQALIALLLTCVGIFVYVWLRFEWQFATGAIVALVHDVFLTIGVFSLLQLDFNLAVVAALLTILGYSINDTVVIFDRVRENLRKYKTTPLTDLVDLSLNETLSRTVMTTGTTFLALLALYVFGGEVIRNFTFGILFGILIGTYSTVYIASPILVWLGVKRDWSQVKTTSAGARNRTAEL
ncbi:MAG: protein translocase subunit SecF [Hyphomicrobiales bacterium]|nr:protein translocase subunit SecF [Hyphomicrobiales bacterium]